MRNDEGVTYAVWRLDDIDVDTGKNAMLRIRPTPDTGARVVVQGAWNVYRATKWVAPVIHRAASKNRKQWLVRALAAWLALFVLWHGAPLALDAVTALIPRAWERSMGEQARDTVGRLLSGTLTGEIPWKDEGPGFEALQALVARLAKADGGDAGRFQASILDSGVINAFAMPGGFIVVTTGLIRQCRSPDELAGVLAHEMAHVTERHSTRRLVREEFFSLAGKLATGGGTMDVVNSVGNTLLVGKFSRDDERAADILGTRRLAAARINPRALVSFFEGLGDEGARHSYLSSHPATADRKEYMRRETVWLREPFSPAVSSSAWQALKDLAAGGPR